MSTGADHDDDVDDVADQARAGRGELDPWRRPVLVGRGPPTARAWLMMAPPSWMRAYDRLMMTVPAIRSCQPRCRLSMKIQMKPR